MDNEQLKKVIKEWEEFLRKPAHQWYLDEPCWMSQPDTTETYVQICKMDDALRTCSSSFHNLNRIMELSSLGFINPAPRTPGLLLNDIKYNFGYLLDVINELSDFAETLPEQEEEENNEQQRRP